MTLGEDENGTFHPHERASAVGMIGFVPRIASYAEGRRLSIGRFDWLGGAQSNQSSVASSTQPQPEMTPRVN